MAKEHPLYVVAYDIPTDKAGRRRYRKILKLMENYGDRVQYSVFECRLSAAHLSSLLARLEKLILESEDHIRVYRVRPEAEAITILGEGEVLEIPPYTIL